MTPEEAFGLRLRSMREAREWSLRKAAGLVGITHMRLAELERGRTHGTDRPTRPSRDLVAKLAEVYDVSRAWLMEQAGYAGDVPVVDPEEAHLLELFRSLQSDRKAMAIRVLKAIRG